MFTVTGHSAHMAPTEQLADHTTGSIATAVTMNQLEAQVVANGYTVGKGQGILVASCNFGAKTAAGNIGASMLAKDFKTKVVGANGYVNYVSNGTGMGGYMDVSAKYLGPGGTGKFVEFGADGAPTGRTASRIEVTMSPKHSFLGMNFGAKYHTRIIWDHKAHH